MPRLLALCLVCLALLAVPSRISAQESGTAPLPATPELEECALAAASVGTHGG